jgi:hypothetical protein
MADIVWELLALNAVLIVVSTGLPYTMLFDRHSSYFISSQKDYKLIIKQPKYCHEN